MLLVTCTKSIVIIANLYCCLGGSASRPPWRCVSAGRYKNRTELTITYKLVVLPLGWTNDDDGGLATDQNIRTLGDDELPFFYSEMVDGELLVSDCHGFEI